MRCFAESSLLCMLGCWRWLGRRCRQQTNSRSVGPVLGGVCTIQNLPDLRKPVAWSLYSRYAPPHFQQPEWLLIDGGAQHMEHHSVPRFALAWTPTGQVVSNACTHTHTGAGAAACLFPDAAKGISKLSIILSSWHRPGPHWPGTCVK